MKTGNTDSIAKCARGPLHLRRAAMKFGTFFISLFIGSLGYQTRASPPFIPVIFVRSLQLFGQEYHMAARSPAQQPHINFLRRSDANTDPCAAIRHE